MYLSARVEHLLFCVSFMHSVIFILFHHCDTGLWLQVFLSFSKERSSEVCLVWCRYKERVRERYIKSLDADSTMKFIDSKNWMFLKQGLDDFRNGMPPSATDDIFVKVYLVICYLGLRNFGYIFWMFCLEACMSVLCMYVKALSGVD